MVKEWEKKIIVVTTVIILLILIVVGSLMWEAYKYADCLKVGHSNGYCFGRMLE